MPSYTSLKTRERRIAMTQIRSPIKVTLEKRGQMTIRPSDYVATGGEGSIYRASGTVIKLYTDQRKIAKMTGKIEMLSRIKHPYIVAPHGVVYSHTKEVIGIHMPYVDGEPLPRIFTNDFRAREKFTDTDAAQFALKMREAVQFAHAHNALLVDSNELNWLASLGGAKGPEPRVIDVDSWSIGAWPATVIMQTIRDHHTKGFTQLTDWFAWGIVTFQIFTGIHPYKGTINGFKPGDLEGRMKANASVFSPKIKLNRAVRDFSRIGKPLLEWYAAVFQKGERSIPPSPLAQTPIAQAAVVKHIIATPAGNLIFDKLYGNGNDPALRIWPCGVILLRSGNLFDITSKRIIGMLISPYGEVIATPNGWLVADWIDGKITFSHTHKAGGETKTLLLPLIGRHIVRYENRVFIVTAGGLTEVIYRDLGRPVISAGNTWGVMLNSTRWFDGIGVQDAMGASFLIMPSGKTALLQIRVRELDGLKPITAKAENGFVAIIAADNHGTYHKLEILTREHDSTYRTWTGITDNPELTMTMLPKGVGVTIIDDGELTIFVPATQATTKVREPRMTTDITLAHIGDKTAYLNRGEVWTITMKNKS
ncbi:MAG: hypothetical protein NUV61_04290 [Candidatus Azambacteria bacterium]|nr:hypothetical protein [Candidatus Azambacteria bacterium]